MGNPASGAGAGAGTVSAKSSSAWSTSGAFCDSEAATSGLRSKECPQRSGMPRSPSRRITGGSLCPSAAASKFPGRPLDKGTLTAHQYTHVTDVSKPSQPGALPVRLPVRQLAGDETLGGSQGGAALLAKM